MDKQFVLDEHQRMCDAQVEYRNAITANAMQMDEVTELAALYETICKTEKEIEEQNQE